MQELQDPGELEEALEKLNASRSKTIVRVDRGQFVWHSCFIKFT